MNITLSGTKVSMDGHTLAFQKNNLVDSMVITVDTDETWQYKLDVKYPCKDSNGKELYNVIDVPRVGNTCTAILQASMLPFNGKYTMQLRGISSDKVYHTDTFDVWVKYSIDPGKVYDPVPSEFYQIEQSVTEQAANAKQSAMESAESARQSAESSVNAANSANEAHMSREAIENMEVAAASLSPDSDATVEKSLVDGKVKLTFGIPKGEKGENDIFWLNTVSNGGIAETFDEIVAAYKAGKNIWIRDTQSFSQMVAIAPAFLVVPSYVSGDIIGLLIVCGGSAYASSDIGAQDNIMNVTYYIIYDPRDPSPEVYFNLETHMCAELGDSNTPNESQWNGSAGDSTYASPVDHIHPAPFPDWTSSIGKALFVNNANETPSQAFEWRDVPNGDFTSKVGDFLRVAEVDSNNKPTKWTTDSIANAKGVNF